jgi:hypothetical protein
MRSRRFLLVAAIAALTSLGGATITTAHTLVDPTTLTPPLRSFRICYEDGPWVKCDTSGAGGYENQEIFDGPAFGLPCGTIYETETDTAHATRWYDENLLLVERDAQQHITGTWSLSPTGSGPTVAFAADNSWHETFLVPGDLSSDSKSFTAPFASRLSELGSTMPASTYPMVPSTGIPRSPTKPRPSFASCLRPSSW